MPKLSGLRPGETTPVSGQYQRVGPRGGKGPEITSIKGKPLPASPMKGATYKLVDRTRHKSSK